MENNHLSDSTTAMLAELGFELAQPDYVSLHGNPINADAISWLGSHMGIHVSFEFGDAKEGYCGIISNGFGDIMHRTVSQSRCFSETAEAAVRDACNEINFVISRAKYAVGQTVRVSDHEEAVILKVMFDPSFYEAEYLCRMLGEDAEEFGISEFSLESRNP